MCKKGIRRAIALVIVLVVSLLAFAGCASPAEEKKEKFVIGYVHTGTETEWSVAKSTEIIASFEGNENFELLYADSQNVQENQIKAFRNFIQQGVDAIVIRPTVTTGWDSVLIEAKEKEIPVVLVGRRMEMADGDIEDYTMSYIGADNVAAGVMLVETMGTLCKDDAAPVNIVVLEGTVGASAATERITGIDKGMAAQDRLKIYKAQSADWARTKGKEVMEAFLKTAAAEGVEIKGVIAHCDDMALGASQAIEEAGLAPGKDIYLIGVDGARGAFEAMVEGKYNATVENPLGFGPAMLKMFSDYFLNGVTPEKWVVLKNDIYWQADAAEALPNRKF